MGKRASLQYNEKRSSEVSEQAFQDSFIKRQDGLMGSDDGV